MEVLLHHACLPPFLACWMSRRGLFQSRRLHFGQTFGMLLLRGTHVQPQPEQRFALMFVCGIRLLDRLRVRFDYVAA